jgi:hypothetical protein
MKLGFVATAQTCFVRAALGQSAMTPMPRLRGTKRQMAAAKDKWKRHVLCRPSSGRTSVHPPAQRFIGEYLEALKHGGERAELHLDRPSLPPV